MFTNKMNLYIKVSNLVSDSKTDILKDSKITVRMIY